MKPNLLIILPILFVLLFATAGVTFAQTAVAGVSKGETFDYSYSIFWNSTDPTATPPSDYVEFNKTQSIELKVTDVSVSKISLEKTEILRNGTQTTETGYININTGDIEVTFGTLIISANLNANDKLYPSGGHAIINDTTTRTYPSGQRETNHYIVETTSQNNYEKTEIYFDRQKGVAVDYYYENRETSGGYTITTIERLISTNADVWAVGSAPTPTATGISPTPTPTPTATGISPTPTATGISPTPTTAHTPTATPIAFVFSAVDWLIVIAVIIIVLILIILAWYRRRRKPKTQQTQTTYLGTY